MQINVKSFIFCLSVVCTFGLISCNDNEAEFDKTAFLESYAMEFLQPRMQELSTVCARLHVSIEQLKENPNQENLEKF